ncbi:MAG: serine hydrolase [Burkholderiales bacterium]|nr:serine hydrolase [Burkholderiales bacterium]
MIRALAFACAACACSAALALPDDAAVRALLAERIAQERAVGLAAVLLDAGGARIVTSGVARAGGPAIAADTEFEIGSITKTFTALLLADAVVRGEATLADPATKYLPAAKGLARDGKAVTLGQLATHTSGLPPMPGNFAPANPAEPYADYDGGKLVAFVAGDALERPPGEAYAYSNFGASVLGYALTARNGGYEQVLRERVLAPLGMGDSAIALSAAQEARLATGHGARLAPSLPWKLDAFAPAGGLRSTPRDMAKYLEAAVRPASSPLAAAFELAERPAADTGSPSLRIGLAWHLFDRDGRAIVWHNGRTGGFASMMAFDTATREGVVVLSNASIPIDDLALHLLDASIPLSPAPKERIAIKLDPAVGDRLAGKYELARDFAITVRRDGERMLAAATGQGELEIFPESDYEYFYRAVDAQLSFVRAGERVTGLVLRQGGRNLPGKRAE